RRLRADLRLRRRRRRHRGGVRGFRRRAHQRGRRAHRDEGRPLVNRATAESTTLATTKTLREPTLTTLGLGGVHDVFRRGALPVDAAMLVDQVFGPASDRGALVISGANGIVGAGKTMQLGSRLAPFGVRTVALDFPGAPDGIGRQYPGLVQAFGRDGAARIMSSIVRLTYDGATLPS